MTTVINMATMTANDALVTDATNVVISNDWASGDTTDVEAGLRVKVNGVEANFIITLLVQCKTQVGLLISKITQQTVNTR